MNNIHKFVGLMATLTKAAGEKILIFLLHSNNINFKYIIIQT